MAQKMPKLNKEPVPAKAEKAVEVEVVVETADQPEVVPLAEAEPKVTITPPPELAKPAADTDTDTETDTETDTLPPVPPETKLDDDAKTVDVIDKKTGLEFTVSRKYYLANKQTLTIA